VAVEVGLVVVVAVGVVVTDVVAVVSISVTVAVVVAVVVGVVRAHVSNVPSARLLTAELSAATLTSQLVAADELCPRTPPPRHCNAPWTVPAVMASMAALRESAVRSQSSSNPPLIGTRTAASLTAGMLWHSALPTLALLPLQAS